MPKIGKLVKNTWKIKILKIFWIHNNWVLNYQSLSGSIILKKPEPLISYNTISNLWTNSTMIVLIQIHKTTITNSPVTMS